MHRRSGTGNTNNNGVKGTSQTGYAGEPRPPIAGAPQSIGGHRRIATRSLRSISVTVQFRRISDANWTLRGRQAGILNETRASIVTERLRAMFETIAFLQPADVRKAQHCGQKQARKTPATQTIEETASDQPRTLKCRWLITDAASGESGLVAQWAEVDD
jgi:hypothetical protein